MARNKTATKKKQSKASLRPPAATKPTPQNFGQGKAARKEAAALNKKARKARQILGRSIEQEPRDDRDRPKQRRASDSPPLLGWVDDRAGAITNRIRGDSTHGMDGSLQPSKAKKGSKGDISKRKMAMKAAKRQARAKKKAANVQQGARERAKGARRRIEQLKRDEQSIERQKEAHQVVTKTNSCCSPQSSELEVDAALNILEPLLRTIFRIQGIVKATNHGSFAAASPFPRFIRQKLRKAQSIVKMYEGRCEEKLTPLQEHALGFARLAVGELEYMERSDEEEEGGEAGSRRAGEVSWSKASKSAGRRE